MRSPRALLAAAVLAVAVVGTGACSDPPEVSYSPAAYGEVSGGVGHCYYVSDPGEAQQLLAAGLCPAGWVPTLMPLYWHERYDAYYDSPSYYTVYVPASVRTVYVSRETTFRTTYAVQISTASRTATYRGSNGKTVTGPSTAKLKFSSGSGSNGSMNGGSLRGGSTGGMSGGSGSRMTGGTSGGKSTSGGLSGGSLRGRK